MSIINLRSLGKETAVSADVCIVGAGAAGLLLAACLARRGVATVVLEAGGRVHANEKAIGVEAAVEGYYRATGEGRAFGLGGTTTLWGGQLVPHSFLDFRGGGEGEKFDFWRHAVAVVERRAEEVCGILDLRPACRWFDAEDVLSARAIGALRARGWEIVVADWIPFRKRNLAFLADRGGFDVYLHAPAVAWNVHAGSDGGARVESVEARADERTLTVRARAFVVAAGAVETTRILLEIERGMGRPFCASAALGKNLGDHLSCRVADVEAGGRPAAARTFAPRFRDGRMRSFRLIARHAPAAEPRAFFHFIFENENPGFALARKALLALQARTMPRIAFAEAARGAAGVAALAWARYARRRLYVPKRTPAHLQLDIEQSPNSANRVMLSDFRDAAGRWKALVRWSLSAADEEAIHTAASRFLAAWPQGEGPFPRLLPALGAAAAVKPHDVYHPVGTCRMGEDAEAVVDSEARVRGAANLHVASTALFPTAGTANPTFSMLCLAVELAEHLTREGPR